MKISRSEFDRFKATPRHPALRFGQAWYNYFKLHNHTPVDDAERGLLDKIYNERIAGKAERMIVDSFIDEGN